MLALMLLPLSALAQEAEGALERPEYGSRSRVTMDYFSTVCMLQLYDDFSDPARVEAFEQTWEEILALLAVIDAELSLSMPESDVSRFNAATSGETVTVSADTAAILDTVEEVFTLTGGRYDPTVSTLVDVFGFTPRFSQRRYQPVYGYDREKVDGVLPLPEADTVAALRSLVQFDAIDRSGLTLTKNTAAATIDGHTYQQSLDLGGVGKGYAVDRVMALLRAKGYRYGYFSCGGSSIGILSRATASRGAPEAAQWGIAVQYPRFVTENEALLRVFTRDQMLSTSGDYEHAYVLDGVHYSHLIDPQTGWPVNMPIDGVQSGICSVTILGDNAAFCDALSTALCVLGVEEAIDFMNQPHMQGYSYLMILYSDASEVCEIVTDLPAERYELLDPERFVVVSAVDAQGRVTYHGNMFPDAVGVEGDGK